MVEYVTIFNVFSDLKLSKIDPKIWSNSEGYSVEIHSIKDLIEIYNMGLPFVRQFPNNVFETKYIIFDFDWSDRDFYLYLKDKFPEFLVRSPSSCVDRTRYKCKLFYELTEPIICSKESFAINYKKAFENIISDYPYKNTTILEKNKNGKISYHIGKIGKEKEENCECKKIDNGYSIYSHIDYDTAYISNLFQLTYGKPISNTKVSSIEVQDHIFIYGNLDSLSLRHGLSKYVRKAVYDRRGLNWCQKKITKIDSIDWSTYFSDREKAYNNKYSMPLSMHKLILKHKLVKKWHKEVPHIGALMTKKINIGHRHCYLCSFIDRMCINMIGFNNLLKAENVDFRYDISHLFKITNIYIKKCFEELNSFYKDHNRDTIFRLCYEKLYRINKLYNENRLSELDYDILFEYKPRFSKKTLSDNLNSKVDRKSFEIVAIKHTIWSKQTIKSEYYKMIKKENRLKIRNRSKLAEYLLNKDISLTLFTNMKNSEQKVIMIATNSRKSSIIRCLKNV